MELVEPGNGRQTDRRDEGERRIQGLGREQARQRAFLLDVTDVLILGPMLGNAHNFLKTSQGSGVLTSVVQLFTEGHLFHASSDLGR